MFSRAGLTDNHSSDIVCSKLSLRELIGGYLLIL